MVCKFLLNLRQIGVVVKEWRHFKLLKFKWLLLFKMVPSPWQQLTKTGLTKTALTKTALTKTCVCVRIGTITLDTGRIQMRVLTTLPSFFLIFLFPLYILRKSKLCNRWRINTSIQLKI